MVRPDLFQRDRIIIRFGHNLLKDVRWKFIGKKRFGDKQCRIAIRLSIQLLNIGYGQLRNGIRHKQAFIGGLTLEQGFPERHLAGKGGNPRNIF